jgi:hypothetical protein
MGMGDFWMGIAPAQNAVAGTKRADGRHRILSIVGGIAIAVLIGAGPFIVAANQYLIAQGTIRESACQILSNCRWSDNVTFSGNGIGCFNEPSPRVMVCAQT